MQNSNLNLNFTNSFANLGEAFYSRVQPTAFESQPKLVHFNESACELLGLDVQVHAAEHLAQVFGGAHVCPAMDPVAMLYCGHQFGHLVPQLGDGRAIILGEVENAKREKWEIQLKGAGITPYSRDGDGRAVLRSTIREYLCSEAMHALGIPTTRALCMYSFDDEVYRESIEPGAILTRLAPSHVRFGSFEVFYYRNQFEHIKTLADYIIDTHYHDFEAGDYLAWFREVIDRTAKLIAQWQAVGFCHGVMNSDNMSILGLTLDYGPYAFMDAYDPGFICNHSDHQGRYAYDQQPRIGLFNLSCFAQAILPLFGSEPEQAADIARAELEQYSAAYQRYYLAEMRSKLGLQQETDGDDKLIADLLRLMAQERTDYTILFRALCEYKPDSSNNPVRDLFMNREAFDQWADQYTDRLQAEQSDDAKREACTKQHNPKFVLRNYMAEAAIRKAQDDNDYSEVKAIFDLLQKPYDEQPDNERYAGYPPDWASKISVSCSS